MDQVFWATKLNVRAAGRRGRSGGGAGRRSRRRSSGCRRSSIDLIQVHNMGDVKTQLPILKDLEGAGAHPLRGRHHDVRAAVSGDRRDHEEPSRSTSSAWTTPSTTARSRRRSCRSRATGGIGVFVYAPFGRTRLFRRVGDRPAARLGRRVRREDVGAVLPEVRAVAPGRHGRHAGHQPGEEHDGQPGAVASAACPTRPCASAWSRSWTRCPPPGLGNPLPGPARAAPP